MRFTNGIMLLLIVMTIGCYKMEIETVSETKAQIMEVACGECMFDLPGDGCDLAVRYNGKAYFVAGTGIDDHGDAHSDDGFCNAIRKAEVRGELIRDVFHVTELQLLP